MRCRRLKRRRSVKLAIGIQQMLDCSLKAVGHIAIFDTIPLYLIYHFMF